MIGGRRGLRRSVRAGGEVWPNGRPRGAVSRSISTRGPYLALTVTPLRPNLATSGSRAYLIRATVPRQKPNGKSQIMVPGSFEG